MKRVVFSEVNGMVNFVLLPHSKDISKRIIYGENGGSLYEIQKAGGNRCGSWLHGDELIQDGSFIFITDFDSSYILLSILKEVAKISDENPNGVFCQFDQIFQNFKEMKPYIKMEQIEQLCEIRDMDGEKFYRVSVDKVAGWIVKKFKNILEGLKNDKVFKRELDLSQSDFIVSMDEVQDQNLEKRYTVEAIRFLNMYVLDLYIRALSKIMGVENEIFPVMKLGYGKPVTGKKRKRSAKQIEAEESQDDVPEKKKQKKEEKKKEGSSSVSRGVASLMKVNTKGMKKITSFFQKKKKKKKKK